MPTQSRGHGTQRKVNGVGVAPERVESAF
jgi:hypothetical protein